MKNLALILAALFLTVTLSACATSSPKKGMKIKCPACGHEFIYDDKDPGT